MVRRSTNRYPQSPVLGGLADNMALDDRAIADSNAYYTDQLEKDFGNPQAYAETLRQRSAATMPGDPQGFRMFNQALKERNIALTPKSGFQGNTPKGTVWDPERQTGEMDPALALAYLTKKQGR